MLPSAQPGHLAHLSHLRRGRQPWHAFGGSSLALWEHQGEGVKDKLMNSEEQLRVSARQENPAVSLESDTTSTAAGEGCSSPITKNISADPRPDFPGMPPNPKELISPKPKELISCRVTNTD